MRWSVAFEATYPIEQLRGAQYNPRHIDAEAVEALSESIRRIGFVKPVIVQPDGLLIAGHQRTRAARAMGLRTVPAYILRDLNLNDEIRFNQFHNGVDLDTIEEPVRVPASDSVGFEMVGPGDIAGNPLVRGAIFRSEIARLIAKYGPWGAAAATPDGELLAGPHYALTCRSLGIPCLVYRVPADAVPYARSFLSRTYGEFSYQHLPRHTFIQSYAQMRRLEATQTKKNHSSLYEGMVMLELRPGERLLDFGCGTGAYVKLLRSQGHHAHGVEFFFRKGDQIDTRAVHRMIDGMLADLDRHGRFDVVVVDSVLNSVDSLQAEADVLTCAAALCKPGGRVYFSGRRREFVDASSRMRICANKTPHRYFEFLDDDGFSGLFRQGHWYYQKFHTEAQAKDLAGRFFGETSPRHTCSRTSWQLACKNNLEHSAADVEAALRREFDLAWPDGSTVGRAEKAVAALLGVQ